VLQIVIPKKEIRKVRRPKDSRDTHEKKGGRGARGKFFEEFRSGDKKD